MLSGSNNRPKGRSVMFGAIREDHNKVKDAKNWTLSDIESMNSRDAFDSQT